MTLEKQPDWIYDLYCDMAGLFGKLLTEEEEYPMFIKRLQKHLPQEDTYQRGYQIDKDGLLDIISTIKRILLTDMNSRVQKEATAYLKKMESLLSRTDTK